MDGAADTLTGEQLELNPDSLCLAFKTTKDKKLNVNLMNSLHQNAHKKQINNLNPGDASTIRPI